MFENRIESLTYFNIRIIVLFDYQIHIRITRRIFEYPQSYTILFKRTSQYYFTIFGGKTIDITRLQAIDFNNTNNNIYLVFPKAL